MRNRKLGKTNLEVSIIGFGASPLGNVFGDVRSVDANRAVELAIDQGINLFDVSPYYGLSLAEERLGQALVGKRSFVSLATKCGRYGVDRFDFSAQGITRNFEQSLRRLRTDYVDLLQAHDVEFGEVNQILGETIPAMQRLQDEGKVRYIGLTGYWPGLLARLASRANVDCVLNYCHANLFVQDIDLELVPAIRRTGIGFLNASPLHMGLLASETIPAWHPAPTEVRQAAVEVRAACKLYGVDPGTLGLHVCMNHPEVTSTVIGISSELEVAAACRALDWTPEKELMQIVRRIVQPVHNIVWPSGLDQNQDASLNEMRSFDVPD